MNLADKLYSTCFKMSLIFLKLNHYFIGKVAKQWKRMQGSSSAPNTSYPEGGSIGNFFLLNQIFFFCYFFVEKYNLHTHICNTYLHKYVEWPKKIERSTQYYRKKWTIFRDTQIFFFR